MMNDLMRRVEEGIQKQSFGTMLGLKAVAAEAGCVTISCEKRADLLQQTGLLHGGVTGALCEAAAAYAALTVLPEGQSVIGVEYKINFLRAITSDKAIAVAKVIKQGRQLNRDPRCRIIPCKPKERKEQQPCAPPFLWTTFPPGA